MILSCFGDSITRGMHDEIQGGRFYRLQVHLAQTHPEAVLHNNGVPGDTTYGLLERFDRTCREQQPSHILLAIGTNDSREEETPPTVFVTNMHTLIDKAHAVTPQVTVIGLPGLSTSKVVYAAYGYTIQSIHRYNELLQQVCRKAAVPFFDIETLLTETDFHPDGLHPNAAGHEKLFQTIRGNIEF